MSDVRLPADLLGGQRVLDAMPVTDMDTHDLLMRGLPADALQYLVDHLQVLQKTVSLEKAMGMSLRTFQRRRDGSGRPLSQEQSGRMWKFAEILSTATRVLGTQRAAEEWLEQPAMALDQRRPLDLLATPAGVAMVERLLGRIEHGVYT